MIEDYHFFYLKELGHFSTNNYFSQRKEKFIEISCLRGLKIGRGVKKL